MNILEAIKNTAPQIDANEVIELMQDALENNVAELMQEDAELVEVIEKLGWGVKGAVGVSGYSEVLRLTDAGKNALK